MRKASLDGFNMLKGEIDGHKCRLFTVSVPHLAIATGSIKVILPKLAPRWRPVHVMRRHIKADQANSGYSQLPRYETSTRSDGSLGS